MISFMDTKTISWYGDSAFVINCCRSPSGDINIMELLPHHYQIIFTNSYISSKKNNLKMNQQWADDDQSNLGNINVIGPLSDHLQIIFKIIGCLQFYSE